MVITGPVNWSIHHNIYGWVCNASKTKVWLSKAEQVSAWFIEYWSCKTRGFCSFVCFMGKERWKKSITICWAGLYFYLMQIGLNYFIYYKIAYSWLMFFQLEYSDRWEAHTRVYNEGNNINMVLHNLRHGPCHMRLYLPCIYVCRGW